MFTPDKHKACVFVRGIHTTQPSTSKGMEKKLIQTEKLELLSSLILSLAAGLVLESRKTWSCSSFRIFEGKEK